MKKTLVIPMLVVMFFIMATTAVFAASNLADQIYNMGKPYGVTSEHKVEMERYFNTHPVSAEDEKYVIAKANEAIAIMDKAGIKDVTKLSDADMKKVQNLVKDAANKIGVAVQFTNDGVIINGKDGKVVATLKVTPSTEKAPVSSTVNAPASNGSTTATNTVKAPATTSTTKKYVYTGANYTVPASVAASIVAVVAIVKLRKNA